MVLTAQPDRVIEPPVYDVDFYSDEVIADPYPHYRAMRDLAPVVRLPQQDGYALTRFADVRDALRDADTFRSGHGIMMNEPLNAAAGGMSTINMDGQPHRARRMIVAKPLMPVALAPLREDMERIADELVEALVSRGQFDGVADFGRVLPVTLVTKLVGLPEEGRSRMLDWASGIFNVVGSINARFHEGAPSGPEAEAYLQAIDPADLMPGSWGRRLFELVDNGTITDAVARSLLFDYVAPALDTTINATSSALWLLGRHPDQWEALRVDPALIPAAIDEAMRLETPIRAFSRRVERDHVVDGVRLPEGARVLLVYASANRDERYWPDADRFDIRRKAPHDQLAFGTGVHMCVGMHLARLEMRCLLAALAARVKRFTVDGERRELHNVLRGLASFTVTIEERA